MNDDERRAALRRSGMLDPTPPKRRISWGGTIVGLLIVGLLILGGLFVAGVLLGIFT